MSSRDIFIDQRTYNTVPARDDRPGDPIGPLSDLVEPIGDGALPVVADLDPYVLGATPSAFGRPGEYGQRDPYVPRTHNDVDKKLASALAGNRMVLLVGPSKSGKTRTLYEAVRSYDPQARLISPLPGALSRIAAHPEFKLIPDRVVVWLDDVNRFLVPPDPLSPTLLAKLKDRKGPTTVVATMRTEAREPLHDDTGELTRETRSLLDQSAEIPLSTTQDDSIERAAAARAYPGTPLEEYGLAAVLAGAPNVLRHYDAAKFRDPLQYAVIEVVIDWARVGRPGPIMEPVLAELATEAFRSMHPELDVSEQQVSTAIKTARTTLKGAGGVAPLVTSLFGEQDRGYRPFDYLVAADNGQDHAERPIPETFWQKAIHDADPNTLFAVGLAALYRGNGPEASTILLKAADTGDPEAMFNFAVLLAQWDQAEVADMYYRKAAEAGYPLAMSILGARLNHTGKTKEGWSWYRKGADTGDPQSMRLLAFMLQGRGETKEAESWYRKATDTGDTEAMSKLGDLLEARGETAEAESWHRRAADTGDPRAMLGLAHLLDERGENQEAETWYRKAAETGNPDAMYSLGDLLKASGETKEAESWHRKAAETGDPQAMSNFGALLASRGETEEAESWFRKAVDAGNSEAMFNLGVLLDKRGETEEAETWYRKAAEADDPKAMVNLGIMLDERGENQEAETWYRKAIDAGQPVGMTKLGELREKQGKTKEAETWYRKAIDAGDPRATFCLGVMIVKRGDLEEAEAWFRKGADIGDPQAMAALRLLHEHHGVADNDPSD